MPLRKDPNGGGTEQDGSVSHKYCSFCYDKGTFRSPEIDTAEKMQAFCVKQMKQNGMNGFLAWMFTRSIPRLERWKN